MPHPAPLLCADIGGSFIDCAVVNADGALAHRNRVPTPTTDLAAFLAALATMSAGHAGLDMHIALAGLQDPASGLCTAANIPCINGIDLERRLAAAHGCRVRIGNDADCFTLAESRCGVARGHDNVLGIILGTGVGGGLVIGGRLVTGAAGLTGEWGHGPVIPHIAGMDAQIPCFPCGCGQRGCIDTIGGARGLERLHRWSCGCDLDSHAILGRWRDGETDARRTIAIYIDYLSSALALAINLTGATAVPVGGGLSNAPDLIAALDEAVRARILRRADATLLTASRLGGDAGLIGAAFL